MIWDERRPCAWTWFATNRWARRERAGGAPWRVLRRAGADAHGQASIELLGAVPALIVLGLALFQILAVGYSSVLAGAAAEAGALALAGGGDPEAGVRNSMPGWARARARTTVAGDTVLVVLRPPSPLDSVARELEVTAGASVGEP